MTHETTKETVPPYLSVIRMERVLELAKTRSLNEVSVSLFTTYGFSPSDAALSVKLLKFLGAVDGGGKATEVMKELRWEAEERRKEAFASIVRAAYSKLFDAVKEPYNLPRKDLADEFKVQYQQSRRIVETALPVFLKLCEHAGFTEPGAVVRKSSSPRTERKLGASTEPKAPKRDSGRFEEDVPTGSHVQHILKGKMSITIPEEDFLLTQGEDDMSKKWREVVKAALAFAPYLQEKPKPDSESGNGDS